MIALKVFMKLLKTVLLSVKVQVEKVSASVKSEQKELILKEVEALAMVWSPC